MNGPKPIEDAAPKSVSYIMETKKTEPGTHPIGLNHLTTSMSAPKPAEEAASKPLLYIKNAGKTVPDTLPTALNNSTPTMSTPKPTENALSKPLPYIKNDKKPMEGTLKRKFDSIKKQCQLDSHFLRMSIKERQAKTKQLRSQPSADTFCQPRIGYIKMPNEERLRQEVSNMRQENRGPEIRLVESSIERCLKTWCVDLTTDSSSVYGKVTYTVVIKFNSEYPKEAPKVRMRPPAPEHPCIYINGDFYLKELKDWKPSFTVYEICKCLLNSLNTCGLKERPKDNEKYCNAKLGLPDTKAIDFTAINKWKGVTHKKKKDA